MSPQTPAMARQNATFYCLLAVSDWQSVTEHLERNMRRLRSQTTEPLETAIEKATLKDLAAFRRKLAAPRESIADDRTQLLVATGTVTARSADRQVSRLRRPPSDVTLSQLSHI